MCLAVALLPRASRRNASWNCCAHTGVDYLQGYYISKPLEQATDQTGNYSVKPIPVDQAVEVSCIGDLCFERQPVGPQMLIAEAVAMFRSNPQWETLPVVQDSKPVGLVRRDALLLLLSKPLFPEIFNPKPVSRVMESNALVIDERSRLSLASRLITRNRQSRINEEFIVARDGRYLGLARSVELLHHITEERLREAQQSNPLTLLPGNREIDSEVFRPHRIAGAVRDRPCRHRSLQTLQRPVWLQPGRPGAVAPRGVVPFCCRVRSGFRRSPRR